MATNSTAQYSPGTGTLFRLLYGLPDPSIGHSIAELPETVRGEALLIACANDGLIEFGELRFAGGHSDAEYWHRHDFGDNRPYRPFLQAALAGRALCADGTVIAPGRVRLTGKGETTVAGWTTATEVAKLEAEQDTQPEPVEGKNRYEPRDARKAIRPPWWDHWEYWGVGVDEENGWHLFHFQPHLKFPKWSRHKIGGIRFSQGQMEQFARQFAENGRLVLPSGQINSAKPIISRLRSCIREAIKRESRTPPSGDPIPFRKADSCWLPAMHFGTVWRDEHRHLKFRSQRQDPLPLKTPKEDESEGVLEGLLDQINAGDQAAANEAIVLLRQRIPGYVRRFMHIRPQAEHLGDELDSIANEAIVRAVYAIQQRPTKPKTANDFWRAVESLLDRALSQSLPA